MIEQADLEKKGGSGGEGRRRGVWKWECVDEARRRRSYGKDKRGVGERTGPIAPPKLHTRPNRRRAEHTYGVWVQGKGGRWGKPSPRCTRGREANCHEQSTLAIAVFGFATVQHTVHTFLVSCSGRVVAVVIDLEYIVYVSS